ncbi:MAG: NAD(P)/FAD-dependent oxidoreductase [candidate division KSB1 bacterium]|nr:NAD(P)/FAD-dependent oxidoreductase [candidate division KSB1 bacterium]
MHTDFQPTVIVGASIAGLYCAHLLASRGLRVTVFDQLPPQRMPPSRTLIVTGELLNLLPQVAEAGVIRNTVNGFRLHTDGHSLHVPLQEPDIVVERRDLLALVERMAVESGAELRRGYAFQGMLPTADGLVLEFREKDSLRTVRVLARSVVAADGATSHVARCAELDGRPRVPILQAKVELPPACDPHTVDTWFEPEATPYFFWLIPDSPRTAAVGLAAESPQEARGALLAFLNQHRLCPLAMEAAWVPLYPLRAQPVRRFGSAQVYLVGDSAGQVKETTVGGTVTGLKGAAAAAAAISTGSSYLEQLRELRRELLAHHLLRVFLSRFTRQDYLRLFASLNPRGLSLLASHNRDHLASMLSRLVLAQPGLVVLAARTLLRGTARPTARR